MRQAGSRAVAAEGGVTDDEAHFALAIFNA